MPIEFTEHPILKPPTDEEIVLLGEADPKLLEELHKAHEGRIQAATEDPIRHGFDLPGWERMTDSFKDYNEVLALGGNRCLAAEQEIFDPVAQKSRRVDEIDGDFNVIAYDEINDRLLESKALAPFRKPAQDLYCYQLSDGEEIHCSSTHRVLSFGSYHPIADVTFLDVPKPPDASLKLLPSSASTLLVSTVDIYLSELREGVQHCFGIAQDSQWRCSVYFRQCDGLPPVLLEDDLDSLTPLDDALKRMEYAFSALENQENKPQCIRLYLVFDLPSIQGDPLQIEDQSSDTLSDASCKPCKSASQLHEGQESLEVYQQSIVEFSLGIQSSLVSGPQGIRCYCILAYSCYGDNRSYYSIRVSNYFLRRDTVWDFTVPTYHNYLIGNVVNHNSGKTTGCAKRIMEAVSSNNDGHIVCFSQNADTSIKVQQPAIWEMMPKEFKKKTKSIDGYINYSMQNGFTGSSFVFPDTRTRVDFKTYTQYSNNATILEGFEFGFRKENIKAGEESNIGAWLDEYLGDASLVNTLRFRLATRDSKMVIGFTPIDGYTPFISDYLKGAETLETRPAALLNNKELPIKQYSPSRDAAVIYLHSDENPFGGYERIAKDLAGRPDDEIKVRAYGLPVKSANALLPFFNTEVNVLSEEPNKYEMTFPDISDKSQFTCYQVVDPAGARNYTCIWAGVNEQGEVYIRREWPDRDTYGEWAMFGDPKWKYGPAAKKIGLNVEGYCELFKEIEDDLQIEVTERIGDSRFFARENENNDDLFTSFYDYGLSFIPSDGKMEEQGITALDDWFNYNPNVGVDEANRPLCYIHKDCGNLIDSLINYNSAGKSDEPLKDFFDVIRYLRMSNSGEGPDFFSSNEMQTTNRGKGGY